MSLRIFEEPAEARESTEQEEVSFFARLLFCGWASLVAVVPAITTAYSALGVTNVFRGMTNAENANPTTVLARMHTLNMPLAVALGVASLLALAMFIVFALNARHRLAAVGFPFSIGVPIIAATPALFLWFAETTTMDVFAGKIANTDIPVVARSISLLLFSAMGLGLLAQGAIFFCAIISLFIPVKRRTDPLSFNRAMVWGISATVLLAFAAAYGVLV